MFRASVHWAKKLNDLPVICERVSQQSEICRFPNFIMWAQLGGFLPSMVVSDWKTSSAWLETNWTHWRCVCSHRNSAKEAPRSSFIISNYTILSAIQRLTFAIWNPYPYGTSHWTQFSRIRWAGRGCAIDATVHKFWPEHFRRFRSGRLLSSKVWKFESCKMEQEEQNWAIIRNKAKSNCGHCSANK